MSGGKLFIASFSLCGFAGYRRSFVTFFSVVCVCRTCSEFVISVRARVRHFSQPSVQRRFRRTIRDYWGATAEDISAIFRRRANSTAISSLHWGKITLSIAEVQVSYIIAKPLSSASYHLYSIVFFLYRN